MCSGPHNWLKVNPISFKPVFTGRVWRDLPIVYILVVRNSLAFSIPKNRENTAETTAN